MAKRKVGKQKKTTASKGKAQSSADKAFAELERTLGPVPDWAADLRKRSSAISSKRTPAKRTKAQTERRAKMDRAMAKMDSAKARMDSTIKAEESKISPARRRAELEHRIKMLEKDLAAPEKKAAPKKKAATKKAVPKKTAPKKKAKIPTSKAGKKTGKSTIESGRALRERGTKAMRDANALIDSMAKSSGKSREPFEYYSGGKRVFGKEAERVRERSNTLRKIRQEKRLFTDDRSTPTSKALAHYRKQREKGKLKKTDPAFVSLAKLDSLEKRFSELGDSSFKEVQQGPGSRSVFSWGGNRKKNNGKK